MSAAVKISVICPVYNEEKYIAQLLEFFLASNPEDKELLLADGGSTDNTCAVIESYSKKHSNIRLLHNTNRYVPFALNLCIQAAQGEYIARVDAHTVYPSGYLNNCLQVYETARAANVGGPVRSEGLGTKGKAIALAMSSKAGVGNSGFRTGGADGYTDTVPFGFWKRSFFQEAGLFDTEMVRNQDDEFNFRTIAKGYRIYMSSKLTSTYYVRDSFTKLFRQYYEYGYYKPLVFKKTGAGYSIRHFIPSLFVMYLCGVLMLGCFSAWVLVPLALYLLLLCSIGFTKTRSVMQVIYFMYSCLILHTAYGAGFIAGLMKWIL